MQQRQRQQLAQRHARQKTKRQQARRKQRQRRAQQQRAVVAVMPVAPRAIWKGGRADGSTVTNGSWRQACGW